MSLSLQKVEIYEDETVLPFRGILVKKDQSISSTIRLFSKKAYEKGEIDWALKLIRPHDSILELGASIGIMSTLINTHFPGISYLAVEANPALIPKMKENHALNSVKCEIINAAVGKTDGMISFNIAPDFLSSSILNINKIKETQPIKQISLRSLIEKSNPSVLISDCEGAEFFFFDEKEIFNDIKKIIIEIHPKGGDIVKLYNTILNLGFKSLTPIPKSNTNYIGAFQRIDR